MGKKRKKNRDLSAARGRKQDKVSSIMNWFFIVEVLLCILIVLLHAKSAGHYANFYPINGTFQNYNPVRRLISGQVPYRDFQDYLGLGHLYLGSIFTLIFGGTYRSSLMAFSFLTLGCFAAISFAVAKVIFKKKEWAIALTDITIGLVFIQHLFSNELFMPDGIKVSLDYALETGNSARFIRGLILPITLACVWIVKRVVEKRFASKASIVFPLFVGIIAGFSFAWSNDYGISCWLCLFLMTFWYSFTEERKLFNSLKAAGIVLFSSIGSIFIFVKIFTFGHFGEWLQSTFGTGGYQGWYYNSRKSYYPWDADFSFFVIIQAGLCVYYLIRMLATQSKKCSEKGRFVFLAYANMVCVCAVQEYRILSGGNNHEIAFSLLFVNILFELLSIIKTKFKIDKHYVITAISVIFGTLLMMSLAHSEFYFDFRTDKEGIYISEMGGNVTSLGKDLVDTAKFLGKDRFFSTYASAQELVSGQFQPSGTDYIIHVLGDEHRAEYMNVFHNDDFRYVTTIKESYTDWEYWVQRANWFLYRELYKEWHPVYANTYEVYWERNDANEHHSFENGFELSVLPIDGSTAKISIQCESPVNGVADVLIDYEVKSRGNKTSYFNFLKVLKVENTGTVYAGQGSFYESNYLRDKSAEYIPVPIINGYGEVTLTAYPHRSMNLELNKCSIDTVYTVTSDYIEVSEIKNGNTLCVPMSEKAGNVISDISEVIYGGRNYPVEDISQDENGIYIRVAGDVEISEHNIVELVRR